MKLFEFEPDETGYDSYFVMSDTKSNALKALCKLPNFDMKFWNAYKHKYKIRVYGPNEPAWIENC